MKIKKLFAALLLVFSLCGVSFALSDHDYKIMIKDTSYARAEKRLNRLWAEAKKILPKKDFAVLRESQREWVAHGRDDEAREVMELEGLSVIKAYTVVTENRADEIQEMINEY